MKTHLTRRALPAFTLVEMTIVISVSLSLISVVTTSARTWKRNSDRADCVVDLRNFQMAVRSYQNLYGYSEGMFHVNVGGSTDITEQLLRRDLITRNQHHQAIGKETCSGGGTYSRIQPDRFPLQGRSYLNCSLSTAPQQHSPDSSADW
jgi:type II secretory pathway pseudopilin PulG